jgi:hypothetical protein
MNFPTSSIGLPQSLKYDLPPSFSDSARAYSVNVAPDGITSSDIPIEWDGYVIAGVRLPPLHGALDRIIEAVEKELGGKLKDLSRNDKQRAIRLLDDQGAFILRRAVEDVADVMGVSRITVYNYLNAMHR